MRKSTEICRKGGLDKIYNFPALNTNNLHTSPFSLKIFFDKITELFILVGVKCMILKLLCTIVISMLPSSWREVVFVDGSAPFKITAYILVKKER